MNRRWKIMFAAVIAHAAAGAAAAQEQPDSFRLRDIVVTATRFTTSVADAPGSVTVLTRADLLRSGLGTLTDVLRTVPGVAVAQSAGPGALTAVFMRGGESDYVQVLVDGIQVNDPGGSYNWAHLRTEDIERVEVVRGPASVVYGSDAVSGVIQIFTRAGGSTRVDAGVEAGRGDKHADADGSFGKSTFDASLTGSRALGRSSSLDFGVTGARTTSNGLYEYNSDYDNTAGSARMRLRTPRADAAVTLRGDDNEYHYPTSGGGLIVDRNQFTAGATRSFGLDAGYRLRPAIELRILAASHELDTRTENPEDAPNAGEYWSTADQQRRTLDARINAQVTGNAVLTIGAEREWQRSATEFESISQFGTFADTTDHDRMNTGAYAQIHAAGWRALAVTAGARLDENDAFGTFRTGRVAVSWQPLRGARIHAALGNAFKEPTFFENFATGYARGNPDLEPEQSRSAEAGVVWSARGGALSLGATWFHQRFRNLIQYTGASAPDQSSYYNVGAARAAGIEAEARSVGSRHSAALTYTHTATRVIEQGFGEDMAFREGETLLRRPRHHASASVALTLRPRLRLLLDGRAAGSRDDLDFTDPDQWNGVRTSLPAYAVADAGLIIDALQRGRTDLSVTLRVRNILDEQYQEIYNFPAAGRMLQLGVRAGAGLR